MLCTQSPLIIRPRAEDLVLASVFVLYRYIVHDDQIYLNGLDSYTLCTVHVQDSEEARLERTSYRDAIACMLYSM